MKVQLSQSSIEINKLPLKKYVDVFNALGKLPEEVSDMAGKSNDELFTNLPVLVAKFLPQIVSILSVATPLTEDEINELGLDEVSELIVAVIQVNNFGKVADNVKKMMARQSDTSTKQ